MKADILKLLLRSHTEGMSRAFVAPRSSWPLPRVPLRPSPRRGRDPRSDRHHAPADGTGPARPKGVVDIAQPPAISPRSSKAAIAKSGSATSFSTTRPAPCSERVMAENRSRARLERFRCPASSPAPISRQPGCGRRSPPLDAGEMGLPLLTVRLSTRCSRGLLGATGCSYVRSSTRCRVARAVVPVRRVDAVGKARAIPTTSAR